ncbi:MAG: GntR family transcriptional regulator [Arcanobacterium sp.]|nr:GntR family transcriptional regulator [Arcanobacterium sp.]
MEPKYSKVYDALVERIAQMSPGERLESEVKLASSFNVSPMTVRRALMLLSQNGLTIGIPGRGTFVTERASTPPARHRTASPHEPCLPPASPLTHAKLISAALEVADDAERELLRTTDEPFVARIERAHYLDDARTKLVGIEVGIVRADLFPGILGLDLSLDLAEILAGDHWDRQRQLVTTRTIRATIATPDEAAQLHLPKPAALLNLETSFVDADGVTCAETISKFIGDDVEFTA